MLLDRYTGQTTVQIFGSMPDLRFTGKITHMRLDKFIAQQLGVSRAIAGREIRGNRVTVDGEIVRNAAFKLLPEHDVAYDGKPAGAATRSTLLHAQ